jgi:hypothetical protein
MMTFAASDRAFAFPFRFSRLRVQGPAFLLPQNKGHYNRTLLSVN